MRPVLPLDKESYIGNERDGRCYSHVGALMNFKAAL